MRKKNKFPNYILSKTYSPIRCDVVCVEERGKRKYGLLEENQNMIIPLRYSQICISDNYEFAYCREGRFWKIFDLKRKEIVPLKYNKVHAITKSLLAVVENRNHFGMVDFCGNIVIPIIYDDIDGHGFNENEDAFAIKLNEKYGCVSSKNEVIVPFIYDYITRPHYGINIWIATKEEGGYQFLNFNGELIADLSEKHPNFNIEGVHELNNTDLLVYVLDVKGNSKCGIMNADAEWIIPPIYDDIESSIYSDFNNDYYTVMEKSLDEKDWKFGVINRENEMLIPCLYDYIVLGKNSSFVRALRGKHWGVIDRQNHIVISFDYENLFLINVEKGYFCAKRRGRCGVINCQEEIIIPFIYDEIISSNETEWLARKKDKWLCLNVKDSCIMIKDISKNLLTKYFSDGYR